VHGPRHTFLTEAGELTDPLTLQYVAGHDNIKDDYALCSPQANAWEAVPCPGRTKRRVGAEPGAVAIAPHRPPR
jgi:hypothetical protein